MCKQVREGEMPQFPYPLMHPEAHLTNAETETLCAWTSQERLALQESGSSESR
jgi:hypothetical protein